MKDRIKKIRKEFDLTQQKFADRIGVKQNTVAQYEMGRNIPIDTVISLICREFNVNEEWLRTGSGPMLKPLTADGELAFFFGSTLADDGESFKKQLFRALAKLSPGGWQALEAVAIELLEAHKKNKESVKEK